MSSLSRALKTDMMGDSELKALAQVLRSRGRRGDTVLAHITPKEAARLKAMGGSGSINPATGLPEFFEDGYAGDIMTSDLGVGANFNMQPEQPPAQENTALPGDVTAPPSNQQSKNLDVGQLPLAASQQQAGWMGGAVPNAAMPAGNAASQPTAPSLGVNVYGSEMPGPPAPGQEQKSWIERQIDAATPKTSDLTSLLGRGAVAGLGGILGIQNANRLASQGKTASGAIQALGTPQQQQGAELIAQAQRGELSAQSQASYDAARAQLAQQQAQTGGVGAAQAASQLETLRQQLLNNQYQLGLQVSGIGNQYALQAIQQGLQSNQQAAQLSQNFYGSLAQMLAGTPTSISLTPRTGA